MTLIPGTNVSSRVVPFDSLDTYATHDETYGRGSYRSVANVTERNAIPSPRRKEGMLVFCIAENTTYQLNGGILDTNWIVYSVGSSTSDITGYTNSVTLANITGSLQSQIYDISGNYTLLSTTKAISGELQTLSFNTSANSYNQSLIYTNTVSGNLTTFTSNISSDLHSQILNLTNLRKSYTQPDHGFVIGDVLRYTGTIWTKALADTSTNSESLGIVNEASQNTFTLVFSGFTSLPGTSFIPGTVYFLSPTTAGLLTTVEPSGDGQVSKAMFFAYSINTGYVYEMRGDIITNTVFVDTVRSATISGTKTFNDKVELYCGVSLNNKIITSTPYAVQDTDYVLFVDTTSTDITIQLPLNPSSGRQLKIAKIADPNIVTIDSNTRSIGGIVQNLSASLNLYAWELIYNTTKNSWYQF